MRIEILLYKRVWKRCHKILWWLSSHYLLAHKLIIIISTLVGMHATDGAGVVAIVVRGHCQDRSCKLLQGRGWGSSCIARDLLGLRHKTVCLLDTVFTLSCTIGNVGTPASKYSSTASIVRFSLRWVVANVTGHPNQSSAANVSRDYVPQAFV